MKLEQAAASASGIRYDSHAGGVMDVDEEYDEHDEQDLHNVFNVKDDFYTLRLQAIADFYLL